MTTFTHRNLDVKVQSDDEEFDSYIPDDDDDSDDDDGKRGGYMVEEIEWD